MVKPLEEENFECRNGGGRWIRTIEVSDSRFTVCPLWPLGNPPMVMDSFFDYEIPSHNALGIVQGIIFSPADKQEKSR